MATKANGTSPCPPLQGGWFVLAVHTQIPTGTELMMVASYSCIMLAHHAGGRAYIDVTIRARLFRCERVVQRFRHAVGTFGLQAVALMVTYFFHFVSPHIYPSFVPPPQNSCRISSHCVSDSGSCSSHEARPITMGDACVHGQTD